MYLCIKNPGVAPVEGYLLLGVSTTRDCGVAGTIGQFGSGAKHAINVLLRAGLKVVIYCGLTKLEFSTREETVNDGLVTKPIKRVVCKMGGTSTRTVDTGWVLDFGALDWTDLAMALREFVTNAIDRTIREKTDFLPALKDGSLSITTTDKLRACDGYTQVYIEVNEAVMRFYGELPRRFLHFSDRPEQVKQTLLPKAQRNLNGKRVAMIYREGVFVREIEECEHPSIYDYNFRAHQLSIDESRNSSEWAARLSAARAMRTAQATELVPVFESLLKPEQTFESSFDPDYICQSYQKPSEDEQKNWQMAWQAVAGDAVLCGPSSILAEFVERKGRTPRCVQSDSFVAAAGRFGIPTMLVVLNGAEQTGREKLPATASAIQVVDIVWGWIEHLNLTNGKSKPEVGCFRDVMNAGSRTLGFCDDTGVYIADDHASGINAMVLKTALEEVVHWITGATDCSRDFQDFLLRAIVEIAEYWRVGSPTAETAR